MVKGLFSGIAVEAQQKLFISLLGRNKIKIRSKMQKKSTI